MRLGIQVRDKSSSLAFSRRETVRASSTPRGGRDDAALGANCRRHRLSPLRSLTVAHPFLNTPILSCIQIPCYPSLKEFPDFSANETYRRRHSQIMKQAWVQNLEVGKEAENEHTRKQEAYEE